MALSLKQLELLKDVLEETQRTDTGAGHWLPDMFRKDLNRCVDMVKKELRNERVQRSQS